MGRVISHFWPLLLQMHQFINLRKREKENKTFFKNQEKTRGLGSGGRVVTARARLTSNPWSSLLEGDEGCIDPSG